MRRTRAGWALAAIALAALGLALARSCRGPDPKYWVKRAALVEAEKKADAQRALDQKTIAAERARADEAVKKAAAAAPELSAGRERIRRLEAEGKAKDARRLELETELEPVIAANPRLREYIKTRNERDEAADARIGELEAAVATLGPPVETGEVDERGERVVKYPEGSVTWNLWQAVLAERRISKTAIEAADRERGLRLSCDALREDLERQAGADAFARGSADVAQAGVGIYAAVRYKDPLPLAAWGVQKGVSAVWKLLHRTPRF